ncbi:MAG: alkaline phosphatase family protein [Chitinophagaceae bacterium]|nr:alkaline phosphatase family protein [Chitinophagaceae bacterium]
MKALCLLLFLSSTSLLIAQSPGTRNIFIITIDGVRWQEIFTGADTGLIHDPRFVSDTSLLQDVYGGDSPERRREKLLPFFWQVIARKGQLSGNRLYQNKVNVSNFYKISYPGYNEIFTGYADPRPVLNSPKPNNNINVLEYLNTQEEYRGRVAAFCSWDILPYVLNETRNSLPINGGYESVEEADSASVVINQVQKNVQVRNHCRYDALTFVAAKEYIQREHPRVLVLGLGETDEFAHQKKYDLYLQQLTAIDKMISDIWYLVQTDPFYRNNTSFIITTDHGRGRKPTAWYAHNLFVKGSGETWQAMIGAGIPAAGELRENGQIFQKQLAATIAALAGKRFISNHAAAEALVLSGQPLAVVSAGIDTGTDMARK